MTHIENPEKQATSQVVRLMHGIEVKDPFYWLEDQDAPLTRAFIYQEQHRYSKYLDRHQAVQGKIAKRVRDLLAVPSVELPMPDRRGGLLYLKREAKEEQKSIYIESSGRREKLLISIDSLGLDARSSLDLLQVEANGKFLVFGVRNGGEDMQEVGFYDLDNYRLLQDRLALGFYRGSVFDSSNSSLYYVHEEANGPHALRRSVRRHVLGDHRGNHEEVFHAGDDPSIRLVLLGSEDETSLGYLIVTLGSVPQIRFLIHELPLNRPPREIVRLSDATFAPVFSSSRIVACTTVGAPNGRLVWIDLKNPEIGAWVDLAREAEECLLNAEPMGRCWVAHYSDGGYPLTRLYSEAGEPTRVIRYPQSGTIRLGRVDPSARRLFYSQSDITIPPAIYSVDLRTEEHLLWWRLPDPQSNRSTGLETELHSYPSKDGTSVPLTLIRPLGTGRAVPILLSAYGGGGVSMTPRFSALQSILAEFGIACATAHVRGGGEGGREWYLAARKKGKQISVDDLIAAAEWLIERGYTNDHHLGIAGQSAGGLLALCAITQRPTLFRAAITLGPLADLTRFHLFGVARGLTSELGSPEDPEEFAALYGLSPYHLVQDQTSYPAVLIISGDKDKRCDAMHARKMIAQLHTSTAQVHPILLDYTAERGHKPVLPLSERIRALTDRLTFLIVELSGDSLPTEEL